MTLETLNRLDPAAASDVLTACCGAPRWVDAMVRARPFSSVAALEARSDAAWRSMDAADIAAAVAHHPRIGQEPAIAAGSRGSAWSAREQAGALGSGDATRAEFREANAAYERRFGHTFIVCADGRDADELLAALRARMTNDRSTELAITAEELRRITALRLGKLLRES